MSVCTDIQMFPTFAVTRTMEKQLDLSTGSDYVHLKGTFMVAPQVEKSEQNHLPNLPVGE